MAAFGRKTPPGVTVLCETCGKAVSTASSSAAREVTGWVAPRSGGGANHIRNQQPTGRYKHVACLDDEIDPVHARQANLF